jgi:hypothetical protein
VGHSLGCRLILEILDFMLNHRPSAKRNIKVFLMAAAVPVRLVEKNEHLRKGVISLAQILDELSNGKGRLRKGVVSLAQEACVFHSDHDAVLHPLSFGMGQTIAAGEDGWFPEAVGRSGKPNDGLWTERFRMDNYGHNDYWQSAEVVRHIVRALGKKVVCPKPLPYWRPIRARTLFQRRDPAARPGPSSRHLFQDRR